MSCIFVQIPHCFRRYGKLHEVVFKWVTTEGAARSRTWIGCARRKTAQHFRKQGATKNLFGIDLFSHISSHLKWCKFSCNFAERPIRPPGDGPGSLSLYFPKKVLPLNKPPLIETSPEAALALWRTVRSCERCDRGAASADPQNRLLYDIQKHRKTLPPMPPLPRKWRPYWRCMKPFIVCQ